jgi:hypothetical protein
MVAFQEPWAAVRPGLKCANASALGRAGFLFGYGHWALPIERGPVPMLSHSNTAYRRDLLMPYGDRLEAMLMDQDLLQRELRQAGGELLVEPAAVIHHLDFSRFWPWVGDRLDGGRLFGAGRVRADRWPLWRRLLYFAGLPLIPLVNLRRLVGQARRAGWRGSSLLTLLPVLVLAAHIHALGEVAGYLFGLGGARARHDDQEFDRQRFVSSADLRHADALVATIVSANHNQPRPSGAPTPAAAAAAGPR